MSSSNELRSLRDEASMESIEQRLSDLEDRLQDVEDVIASLCDAPRKPGPFSSWVRTALRQKQKRSRSPAPVL
jgi:hypothetical protein